MNNKLMFLFCIALANAHMAQSNWIQSVKQFKFTNRDLMIAGTSAAVISIGSYLFYRLSDNYQLCTAKKLLKDHTITYEYLLDEYIPFTESSFDTIDQFSEALSKINISSDKAIDMISSAQKDFKSIKLDEIDKEIADTIVKLLNKLKDLKNKFKAISNYLGKHKGYFILQDHYSKIQATNYAEFAIQGPINSQQVVHLAKTNNMSMNSAYPLFKYGARVINLHSQLIHAIVEFEKTEGKDSSIVFYTNAVLLEKNIAEIKRILIGLDDYAIEKIKYDEHQKQEALIAAETKRAQAAYDQAQAAKKQVSIAKKQLEETRRLRHIKEDLSARRKIIASQLEDIRRIIGIWNVTGISTGKLDEIKHRLDEIRRSV